ncbi:MAG: hypothetical protein SPK68_09350, partial [Lachnospiraceae bacterium]|nr:hypothetical protein [Lachnospiraceae bacterium]
LQTLDFTGFAKKTENISTHLLTVLIKRVINELQKQYNNTNRLCWRFWDLRSNLKKFFQTNVKREVSL